MLGFRTVKPLSSRLIPNMQPLFFSSCAFKPRLSASSCVKNQRYVHASQMNSETDIAKQALITPQAKIEWFKHFVNNLEFVNRYNGEMLESVAAATLAFVNLGWHSWIKDLSYKDIRTFKISREEPLCDLDKEIAQAAALSIYVAKNSYVTMKENENKCFLGIEKSDKPW